MFSFSPNTYLTRTIKDDDYGSDDVFPPSLQSQSYFSREGSMTSLEGSNACHGDVRSSLGTTAISFQCDTSSGVTSANDESLDAIYLECRYPRAESTNSLACSIRTGSSGCQVTRGPPVEIRPPTVPRRVPRTSSTTSPHNIATSQIRFQRFLSYEPNRDSSTVPPRLTESRRLLSQTFDSQAKTREFRCQTFESHGQTFESRNQTIESHGQTFESRNQTIESRDHVFGNRTNLNVSNRNRCITSAILNESQETALHLTGTRPKKRFHCFRRKGRRYTKPKVRTKTQACLLRRSTVWRLVVMSLVLSLVSCGLLLTVELWVDDSAWDNVGWRDDALEICLPMIFHLCEGGDWKVRHNGNVTQCCTGSTSHVQDLLNKIIQVSVSNKECKTETNDHVTNSTKSNLTDEISIRSRGWYYVYTKVHFKKTNCRQDISTWANLTARHGFGKRTLSQLVKTCVDRANNSSATSYTGGLYKLDKDTSVFVALDSTNTIDIQSSYIGTMKVVDL